MSSQPIPNHLFRIDPLTGVPNLLAFLDLVLNRFDKSSTSPGSVVLLDINRFSQVEPHRGDALLRWIAIVLSEETQAEVYRIGGDEFAILIPGDRFEENTAISERVYQRLNDEATRLGLEAPLASIIIIHYSGEELYSSTEVLGHLNSAMINVKENLVDTFKVFSANQMPRTRHWIVDNMINRIVALGGMLEETQHLAFTDPLTGLPNMRAAIQEFSRLMELASNQNQPFSLLLIDGDDLGNYNEISYAAGDEMIHKLSQVLKDQLRPSDFIARWRMGDEFLILLPQTPFHQAVSVGERLCQSVQQVSSGWLLPVTVSIGVSGYPGKGDVHEMDQAQLLHLAEQSLEKAKLGGKNRVAGLDLNPQQPIH